jgi:UDP-glucose 4-epimerase
MNCLVLGGNGFIGSHLVDRLLQEKYSIRVLDKYTERYRIPLKNIEYIYEDMGNRGLLNEVLENIDVVYHLIGTTTPKTSNDDPAFDIQSNVLNTLYLLDSCIQHKIKKFIYISSGGTVYGNSDKLPLAENHILDPISSYGISKLTVEKYLQLYHKLYGIDYAIVRPSNPYGERQNPEGIQGAISVFLGKIFKNENIELWGDGSVVRDFIYIKDLTEGIVRVATRNTESRIFNLGSGKGYSLTDLIKVIAKVTKREINVINKPSRVFDVPAIYLDISRARKELEWSPSTSLEDGIMKTWEFIQTL